MPNSRVFKIEQLMSESGVRFGTSGARGLVESMTNEVCYAYTAAFLKTATASSGSSEAVVLGHDLRPSSPRISAACAAAIRDAGRRVIYAGPLPTPALAYFAGLMKASAVVVTGSHIPFDRNGIKFYRPEGEISKADESAIQSAQVSVPQEFGDAGLGAPALEPLQQYLKRYLDFFGAGALTGARVAVYEHSSVARDVLRQVLEGLGAQVISLGRTDRFVPIDTEAVRPEDVVQGRAWAKEHAFDAILSTDGDADRPLIGDENGEWLRGDVVGILCSRFLSAESVVTPVSSNTALEKCGWFPNVVRTRIGSPYVIAGMQQASLPQRGVVVGYEANGGFLLGGDVLRNGRRLTALPTRDALLPMLALLVMARERGCRLSQLLQDLPRRFTASDRLQDFPTDRSTRLIAQLQSDATKVQQLLAPSSGAAVRQDLTDGLRVTFANGDIVHLRPSGNAPELRCYAESDSTEAARQLCDACLKRLAGEMR